MIKATVTDRKWITELLVSSFADNPSVRYIISGENFRLKRTRALMEYSFDICMRFGEVWFSEDLRGCALLLFPHRKRTGLSSVWLDLKLIFRTVGLAGVGRVMRRERLVSGKQPKVDMVYLWFIGVDPSVQHAGIGSQLLAEIVKRSENSDLPVYLETSVTSNLSWYKGFGFEIYDELDLGYHLHFLRKPN